MSVQFDRPTQTASLYDWENWLEDLREREPSKEVLREIRKAEEVVRALTHKKPARQKREFHSEPAYS